jgi:hypothetical protein
MRPTPSAGGLIERHTGHADYGATRKRRKVSPSAAKAGLVLIPTYGLKTVPFKDGAFLQLVKSTGRPKSPDLPNKRFFRSLLFPEHL